MNLTFARINLDKTNYKQYTNFILLDKTYSTIEICNNLYNQYTVYKKFESVVPIFNHAYLDETTDIIGYFDNNILSAFSLIKRWDSKNAECVQFAWDYKNPKLRLGIKSLENECAFYKNKGFKYLYLGLADEYKSKINGYELVGKL